MKSGMLAADAIYPLLTQEAGAKTVASLGACDENEASFEAVSYEEAYHNSWVADELKVVRNCHASFHAGLLPGMVHTALSTFITQGKEPWTLKNTIPDSAKTYKIFFTHTNRFYFFVTWFYNFYNFYNFSVPAKDAQEIIYPKNDGVLSFDLLTNLQRSGIWESIAFNNHDEIIIIIINIIITQGTAHDHDQPAHLKVKEECKNIPSGACVLFVVI